MSPSKKLAKRRAPRRRAKSVPKLRTRRATKRTARRSPVTKRAAKRVTKRAGKRTAKRSSTPKRPPLALVPRPAPKKPRASRSRSAVTEFAGARANATRKDLALFELERARVAVQAAIQGLGLGAANDAISPGGWSARQIVLHLALWDRELMRRLEAAASRNQRPDYEALEQGAMNAEGLGQFGHLDWEAAKRALQAAREKLFEEFTSVPAKPDEVWAESHAVGEMVRMLARHDRRYADIIKRFRAESDA
jgi:hypothetical protein